MTYLGIYKQCQTAGCLNPAKYGTYKYDPRKRTKHFVYVCDHCEEVIGNENEARLEKIH